MVLLNVKNPVHTGVDLDDLKKISLELIRTSSLHQIVKDIMSEMEWTLESDGTVEAKDICEGFCHIDVMWDEKTYLCPIRMRMVFVPVEYENMAFFMAQRLMKCMVDLQNFLSRLPDNVAFKCLTTNKKFILQYSIYVQRLKTGI